MDIHKPKAAHSWREFLIEIGTIICGILIALGLEQAMEALHSAHKVEAAEEAMRLELAEDDGPQAYVRLAVTPCLSRDIAKLRAAIEQSVAPAEFGKLADNYRPPIRTWDMDAWKSAQSAGVTSLMGRSAIGNLGGSSVLLWADAYDFIPFLQETANQERASLDRLVRSRYRVGRWTEAKRDELSDVLDELTSANRRMAENAAYELLHLHNDGIRMPDEARRNLLAQAKADYGACAVDPDTALASVISGGGRPTPQDRRNIERLVARLTGVS